MWTGALVVDRKIIDATGSDGRGCGASVRLSALVDGKPTWMPAVSVGARVVLCSGRLELLACKRRYNTPLRLAVYCVIATPFLMAT
jgi:hypothetical protein